MEEPISFYSMYDIRGESDFPYGDILLKADTNIITYMTEHRILDCRLSLRVYDEKINAWVDKGLSIEGV